MLPGGDNGLLHVSLTSVTTFYFGVSLSDDSKQDDEVNVGAFVGDPDTLSYQPIRDLNVDVEKLLEHLPSKIFCFLPCLS